MVIEAGVTYYWENPETRFGLFEYENESYSAYNEGNYFNQAFFAEARKQLPELSKLRYANYALSMGTTANVHTYTFPSLLL